MITAVICTIAGLSGSPGAVAPPQAGILSDVIVSESGVHSRTIASICTCPACLAKSSVAAK